MTTHRRQRGALAACLLCTLFLLAGCGKEQADPDPDQLAAYLTQQLHFRDELSPLSEEMAQAVYGYLPDMLSKGAVYVSSGASAEEVAVLTAKERAGVSELEKITARRTQDQRDAFINYLPEEVDLLKAPYLRQVGNTLIYCVGADKEACDKAVEEFLSAMEEEPAL